MEISIDRAIEIMDEDGVPSSPAEYAEARMMAAAALRMVKSNYIESEVVTSSVYDECETHENCTVEVWSNSETGETSVGWYKGKVGGNEN